MQAPPKIHKLDEVVVNRIAAGEVIQRPANALKELIENSLDAKATNIQITVKEGGLKLLQIQDNGTGIRKEDMDIVCERFTTSKLQKFDDLKSIATFGFRGEALASISHVALLTITTKTALDKCCYKASYVDSKLKAPPKPCAGNQGTTILIENLFYNVATRRKALASASEEFARIADVVTRYAIHNAGVGFTLKKHGEVIPQVRTPHNSTKMNNVKILYGNPVARELLEVELVDDAYKFKIHGLITNPNYSSKRMTLLLFINHRLVDSTPIRKMLEELYSIYVPKKTYPWCYISLEINPHNVDVNVHPTKHEVRFLHEDAIIDRIKNALDEKLAGNNASRTFYLQARLPQVDITKDNLREVLPEYDKDVTEHAKKLHPREMIRTSSTDQKLDTFNFTVQSVKERDIDTPDRLNNTEKITSAPTVDTPCEDVEWDDEEEGYDNNAVIACSIKSSSTREAIVDVRETVNKSVDDEVNQPQSSEGERVLLPVNTPPNRENRDVKNYSHWSSLIEEPSPGDSVDLFAEHLEDAVTSTQVVKSEERSVPRSIFEPPSTEDESSSEAPPEKAPISEVADRALKAVHQYYGTQDNIECTKKRNKSDDVSSPEAKEDSTVKKSGVSTQVVARSSSDESKTPASVEFKSYSVNNFRREVKLGSILRLRKDIEDNYHEGLREIISNMTFVGSVDEKSALIQSGLNLYICDTMKLAEELFYEIMLYDFANYGVFKFSVSKSNSELNNWAEVSKVPTHTSSTKSKYHKYLKYFSNTFYNWVNSVKSYLGLRAKYLKEPLPLKDLALLGLDTEEAGWSEEDGSKEDIAASVKELLLEKADMLKEYFSIVIDKRGNLKSLPVLLDKYFPYEAELPLYILRLSTEVDWTTEQPCFDGICRETAKFFSHINTNVDDGHDWKHVVEYVLYRAIKDSLLPPKHFAHDSTILQIASLPDLYKVFERC